MNRRQRRKTAAVKKPQTGDGPLDRLREQLESMFTHEEALTKSTKDATTNSLKKLIDDGTADLDRATDDFTTRLPRPRHMELVTTPLSSEERKAVRALRAVLKQELQRCVASEDNVDKEDPLPMAHGNENADPPGEVSDDEGTPSPVSPDAGPTVASLLEESALSVSAENGGESELQVAVASFQTRFALGSQGQVSDRVWRPSRYRRRDPEAPGKSFSSLSHPLC